MTIKQSWLGDVAACEHGEQCLYCKHYDPSNGSCAQVPELEPGNQALDVQSAPKKFWKKPPECPNFKQDGVLKAPKFEPVYSFDIVALSMTNEEIESELSRCRQLRHDSQKTGDHEMKQDMDEEIARLEALKEKIG